MVSFFIIYIFYISKDVEKCSAVVLCGDSSSLSYSINRALAYIIDTDILYNLLKTHNAQTKLVSYWTGTSDNWDTIWPVLNESELVMNDRMSDILKSGIVRVATLNTLDTSEGSIVDITYWNNILNEIITQIGKDYKKNLTIEKVVYNDSQSAMNAVQTCESDITMPYFLLNNGINLNNQQLGHTNTFGSYPTYIITLTIYTTITNNQEFNSILSTDADWCLGICSSVGFLSDIHYQLLKPTLPLNIVTVIDGDVTSLMNRLTNKGVVAVILFEDQSTSNPELKSILGAAYYPYSILHNKPYDNDLINCSTQSSDSISKFTINIILLTALALITNF
eukprot:GHVL01019588.1.p1 GENE.GHVL01019588.1~~GHVL01019588.1.p1  ORF type:complete len:336 (+),score=70.62 GHVL01019588.1:1156-2163(+)